MNWLKDGRNWKAEEMRGPYRVNALMWKPSKGGPDVWSVRVQVSRPEGGCVYRPNCQRSGQAPNREDAEQVVEHIAASLIAWDQEHGPPLPEPATLDALAAGQERIERIISHLGEAQDDLLKLHSSNFTTRAYLKLANDNLQRTLKVMRGFREHGEMDLSKLFAGKEIIP